MGEGVTINPGSIGASNAELSRYILECSDMIDSIMFRLQGNVALRQPDGTISIVHLKDRAFSPKCVAWVRGKLEENLNKVLFLSTYETKQEAMKEGKVICLGFARELWLYWKEFDLTVEQYVEVNECYRNFVAAAVRIPLYSGHKNFLMRTTNETTQRIDSTNRDIQPKRGLLGGLTGGLIG